MQCNKCASYCKCSGARKQRTQSYQRRPERHLMGKRVITHLLRCPCLSFTAFEAVPVGCKKLYHKRFLSRERQNASVRWSTISRSPACHTNWVASVCLYIRLLIPPPLGVSVCVWIHSRFEFPASSLTNELNRSPLALPYLHLSVLCGIMQGGPPPGVSHDGGAHQQQPVQDGCVAASSCKVEGCGPLVVPCRQADVSEGDLEAAGRGAR